MEANPFPTISPGPCTDFQPRPLSPKSSPSSLLSPPALLRLRTENEAEPAMGALECVCLQGPFLLNGSNEAEIVRNKEYLD